MPKSVSCARPSSSEDVGGFDVAVGEAAPGIVEGVGDLGDDAGDLGGRQRLAPGRVRGDVPGEVVALDVLQGDPEAAVAVAAVVDADDGRVPQSGDDIGLAFEAGAVLEIPRTDGRRGL